MFDIGWQELMIVAAITLIVVGPKDLPRVLSQLTKYLRKARSIAREFQSSIDEVVRQSDLEEIRKEIETSSGFDLEKEVRKSLDPTGDMAREFDMSGIQADLESSARAVNAESTPVSAKPATPAGEVAGPPAPEAAEPSRPRTDQDPGNEAPLQTDATPSESR